MNERKPIGTRYGIRPDVADRLSALEKAIGRDLRVNSGYRSPSRNQAVGGASGSQHLHGRAVDIDVRDMPREERLRLIEEARGLGFNGVGVYGNAIHLDTGPRRSWGPNFRNNSVPEWAKSALSGSGSPVSERGLTRYARAIDEPIAEEATPRAKIAASVPLTGASYNPIIDAPKPEEPFRPRGPINVAALDDEPQSSSIPSRDVRMPPLYGAGIKPQPQMSLKSMEVDPVRVQRAIEMASRSTPYISNPRRLRIDGFDDSLDEPRATMAAGGAAPGPEFYASKESMGETHSGPLFSSVPGRTDELPVSVEAGSFVFPADIVSALGEGNTEAGNAVVAAMMADPSGIPAQVKKAAAKSLMRDLKRGKDKPKFASGGVVPIIAAGGEYVATPSEIANVGGGDISFGHAILDELVKFIRAETIATLKSLPPPAK